MKRFVAGVCRLICGLALVTGASAQESLSFANLPLVNPTSRLASGFGQPTLGLSTLPPDAQGPISASLGKGDARYWADARAGVVHANNPKNSLALDFTRAGAELRTQGTRWTMETLGYGYGDSLRRVSATAAQAKANHVEYRRGSLTEWYANGPIGLEQGFTLAEPPGKSNGQPLTIALAMSGDLAATVEPDRTSLTLTGTNRRPVLRYTGLTARDAAGRRLQSWLELKGDRLLLRVDDRGALYPVVVDPFVQQAELTAADGYSGDQFGWSVALSGSTAVVGAPGANSGQGTVYVFTLSGSTWSQVDELFANDGQAGNKFGWSVAVDESAGVVIAGAPNAYGNDGAAYIFMQPGLHPTHGLNQLTQFAELTASDGQPQDQFGWSVGVSGNTVIVGAQTHKVGSNLAQGAAYVFVNGQQGWAQQAELTSVDGAAGDRFGYSVSVCGSTAMVGAPYTSLPQAQLIHLGFAYIFTQSGGTWTQQAELNDQSGESNDSFGWSVAVGNGIAVGGAPGWFNGQGAAFVFLQSGASWYAQATMTTSDYGAGHSVALDTNTGAIAVGATGGSGAAYVFSPNGDGTWVQKAQLMPSDGGANDLFGYSVSVSGLTFLTGSPLHLVGLNPSQGAAYVFGTESSQQFASLNGDNTFNGNQTVNGNVTANDLIGNGYSLTDLNAASIAMGTANINIMGNATTATNSMHATVADNATIAASANYAINSAKLGGVDASNFARVDVPNTLQAKITLSPSTPASASLNIPNTGTAPTNPQPGDVWVTNDDKHVLFQDKTGTTQQLAFAADIAAQDSQFLTTAESYTDTKVNSEATRAQSEESTLSTAVTSESTRAQTSESGLSTSISNETTRATNAEAAKAAQDGGNTFTGGRQKLAPSTPSYASLNLPDTGTDPHTPEHGDMWMKSSDKHPQFRDNTDTNQQVAFVSDIAAQDSQTLNTAESYTDTKVNSEATRAQSEESTLSTAVTSESTRAQTSESGLSTSISNETTRATAAEAAKSDKDGGNTFTGGRQTLAPSTPNYASLKFPDTGNDPNNPEHGDMWMKSSDKHPQFRDNTDTTQQVAFVSDVNSQGTQTLTTAKSYTDTKVNSEAARAQGVENNLTTSKANLLGGNSFGGNQSITGNHTVTGNQTVTGTASVSGTVATGPLTVGGGTAVTKLMSATFNPNFPALHHQTCDTATFTFTGVADGDTMSLGVPNSRMLAPGNFVYTAWASAANTITIQGCNYGTMDQHTAGTGHIRVDVIKH